MSVDRLDDVYSVTVVQARYSGGYEGGTWLAFPVNMEQLVERPWADEWWDWDGGDIECMTWWETSPNAQRVGRGDTPNDAVLDMLKRIGVRS
jgi:hypothetical protein